MTRTRFAVLHKMLEIEHKKWKSDKEDMKTWGERETRKQRLARKRVEQENETARLKQFL